MSDSSLPETAVALGYLKDSAYILVGGAGIHSNTAKSQLVQWASLLQQSFYICPHLGGRLGP